MLHSPLFGRPVPPRPAPLPSEPTLPLKPWAYVRLRRKAAGLTVDQVVSAIAPQARDHDEVAALIRMLETEGTVARHRSSLELLQRAFPIDPDVYRQLAIEPVNRHPRVCRGCGCSEWDACQHNELGPCSWAGDATCSRCTDGDLL